MDLPFAPIETQRLTLRLVRPEDADEMSCLMTDEVSQWLANWPVPFTPADAAARIATAQALAAAGRAYLLAIVRRDDSRLLGTVRLTRDETPGSHMVTLGFWLGGEFQRQGYMREAARAACDAAFGRLGADRVQAHCRAENAASAATLRAIGMEPSGEGMRYVPARKRDERVLQFAVRRDASGPILGA